ncbi:MAG: hypothetical protein ABL983_25385, partial [Nitrospira sp.]
TQLMAARICRTISVEYIERYLNRSGVEKSSCLTQQIESRRCILGQVLSSDWGMTGQCRSIEPA